MLLIMICFKYDLLNTGAASKIVLFYGKYENINRVRTEFAKFYEVVRVYKGPGDDASTL